MIRCRRLTSARVQLALALGAFSFLMLTRLATAEENLGPNINLTRVISGKHIFRTVEEHRLRGQEFFRMSEHPDKTRTMQIWKDLSAGNSHIQVIMHVAPNFRPIEAFATYWQRDGYKGSIHVSLTPNRLVASGSSPSGTGQQDLNVPTEVAIVTHGEGLNSWGMWPVFDKKQRKVVTTYRISPVRDASAPVLGSLSAREVSFLGEETITVPAGTFSTYHVANELLDIWMTKDDHILVRQLIKTQGLEFVLSEFDDSKEQRISKH